MPIQANQSNGIDFSKDWGAGLGRLLATLEKDGVPRETGPTDIEEICSLYIALEGELMRVTLPVSYSQDDAYLPDEDDEFDDDAITDDQSDV